MIGSPPLCSQVEIIPVAYARRAKNVDVAALKKSVWSLIQEGAETSPSGARQADFQQCAQHVNALSMSMS